MIIRIKNGTGKGDFDSVPQRMASIQGEILQARLFKFGKEITKDGILEIYEVMSGRGKVI